MAAAPPVVLRIKLRYDDVDAMVQRFAINIGKSGLFLPTKATQPVGTEVKFELRLANDTPVLVGLGRVKAAREPDPDDPRAAFGLALELMRVSREGRELIMKMIERRREMGLADVSIPMPDDVDSARRMDVETGVVRELAPPLQSTPVVMEVLPSAAMASTPIAVAKEPSRPIAVVPVLAPEPVKPRRPRVSELIARASQIAAAEADDGEAVDVEAAVLRARLLAAGADMDAELAALKEQLAAPLAEISVEAASAELARQLGGSAVVRKDRTAWVPPPPVETHVSVSDPEPAVPVPEPVAAQPEPVLAAPEPVATQLELEPEPEPAPAPLIDDEADPAMFGAPPEEEHELDSLDLEPLDEQTQIGGTIDPEAFQNHAHPTVPEDLAAALEQHLTQAEADVDQELGGLDQDSEGFSYTEAESDQFEEEISDFDVVAEADLDDADLLDSHGEAEVSGRIVVPQAAAEPEPAPGQAADPNADFASRLDLSDELDPSEFDDERRAFRSFRDEDSYDFGRTVEPPRASTQDRHEREDRFERPSVLADDPPSSSYTFAEHPPDDGLDFDDPHSFANERPGEYRMVRGKPRMSTDDLESALGGLDPDVDVRSPHAVRPARPTQPARPQTGRAPRAATDDGILIDFDDEE